MPKPRKWGRELDAPAELTIQVPGAGLPKDVLRVSLETRERTLGEQRIAMFRDLYQQGGRMHALLRARQEERITTQQLHQAYRGGVAALDALLRTCDGRLLAPLVQRWAKGYQRRDRARAVVRLQRFVTEHGGAKATTGALSAEGIEAWLAALTNQAGRVRGRAPDGRTVRAGWRVRQGTCGVCGTTFEVRTAGPLPTRCEAHDPRRSNAPLKPASGATKNRYRAILSAFCTWCLKHGYLEVHPIAHKRVAKAEEADPRMPAPFAPADYHGYLDAVATFNPDAHVVASVLLHTGADLGEVLTRLPWHVELDRPQPRIRFKRSKTKTPERTVPIPGPAVALLRAHLAQYQPGAERRLFDMVSPAEFLKAHRAGRTAIGRPTLRIKDLRHIAAIAWAQANVRIDRLRTLLGHASLSQTMVYVTYMPDTAEETAIAAASLRQLAGPPGVVPITAARQEQTA